MPKRKTFTLDELNAYRTAYGKPIERMELLASLLKPFAVAFLFTYALFYYWWIGLIAGVIAMVYGYRILIPVSVKRVYEANAFKQRNNFINNLTQILTNSDRTMLNALEVVTERASGEFQKDLYELQTNLQSANNEEIKKAFQTFAEKYKDDVIFELYVEQLTTATIEGRTNIETLKDIKSYHNQLKQKQDQFFNKKKQHSYAFKFICTIAFVLILAITFSFGWTQFVDTFAHKFVGWIFSTTYLIIMALMYHSYVKRLADDKVMEVKL